MRVDLNGILASMPARSIIFSGLNAPSTAADNTSLFDRSTSSSATIAGSGGMPGIPATAFGANMTLGFSANSDSSGGSLTNTAAHAANVALLASYMASTFVTPSGGHGGSLIADAAQAWSQVASLTQPHAAA